MLRDIRIGRVRRLAAHWWAVPTLMFPLGYGGLLVGRQLGETGETIGAGAFRVGLLVGLAMVVQAAPRELRRPNPAVRPPLAALPSTRRVLGTLAAGISSGALFTLSFAAAVATAMSGESLVLSLCFALAAAISGTAAGIWMRTLRAMFLDTKN